MKAISPVAAALIMATLVMGYVLWQQTPTHLPPPRPPKTTSVPSLASRYTARDILATPLALEPPQRRQLEALDKAWEQERKPLEAALTAAQAEFQEFMTEATRRNRARLEDIQARSVEIRQLSAELRDRRASYEAAVLAVLTAEQRAALPRPPAIVGGTR